MKFIVNGPGGVLENIIQLVGFENLCMVRFDDSELYANLFKTVGDTLVKIWQRFLDNYGDIFCVCRFGDDLGMQKGPQISPKMYRELFKPRHAMMWRRAKELADVKVMLHCCGGVRPLLGDLIDAGLDAINPVQINCARMDPQELKDEFGKDLTFWGGGCDTQRILPDDGPEQIQKHVREMIEIFKPDGGFVFQQVHNILAQ